MPDKKKYLRISVENRVAKLIYDHDVVNGLRVDQHPDSCGLHDPGMGHKKCTCGAGSKKFIHKRDGGWWFWDETWSDCRGPYGTQSGAETAMQAYAAALEGEPHIHDSDCSLHDAPAGAQGECDCTMGGKLIGVAKKDPLEPSEKDMRGLGYFDTSWMVIAVSASGEGWIMDAAPGFEAHELLPNGPECSDNGVVISDDLPVGIYRATDISMVTGYDRESGQPDDLTIDVGTMEPLWAMGGSQPHAQDCPVKRGNPDLGTCTCAAGRESGEGLAPVPDGVARAFAGEGGHRTMGGA